MTSLVRISHLPAIDVTENTEVKNEPFKNNEDGIVRLFPLLEKMEELKKRSASLEDLWAVYEKLDSDELKNKLKVKIDEKTQFADSLASDIQQALEEEDKKKKEAEVKHEAERKILRSPLSSPTPKTSRSFFF